MVVISANGQLTAVVGNSVSSDVNHGDGKCLIGAGGGQRPHGRVGVHRAQSITARREIFRGGRRGGTASQRPRARESPVRNDPVRTRPDGGRIDCGSDAAAARRISAWGSRGRSPSPDPNVRTLGRLAMTLNRCHGQLCAREVFSPRQPLPCRLVGRCAGVTDVARALIFLWSAAVTGRPFPSATRSPLSVVLAALSPMPRAAWSRSCPCSLPTWSVRSSSRSLVSVDACCSSRSIGSCA